MNYFWNCDREEFVEFITTRKPPPHKKVVESESPDRLSVRGNEVILAWNTSPVESFSLPRAAIVAEGNVQDFLAWCSTYFRNIRPFTAHCRVESPSTAKLAASASATNWTSGNRSVDIGLIITEAVAYSIGRVDIGRLPYSAFTRTMSYALGKAVRQFAIATVCSKDYQENVEQGWDNTRRLVGNTPLDLSPAEVRAVWEKVLTCGSANRKDVLANAINEIRTGGRLSQKSWGELVQDSNTASDLWTAMEGPREGRVIAVEHGLRSLVKGAASTRMMRAFAIGYLASRVRPGTLDHLSLIFPVAEEFRESLLWYGVCAGVVPETTVDNYGNGLGWLMRRELGRLSHWLDRPTCDIALTELKTLLNSRETGKPEFRTVSRGVLDVEISPLISTNVRWSDHSDTEVAQTQRTLFKEESRMDLEVHEILRRLEESSMSLDAIRDRVEQTFGKSSRRTRKKRR